LAFGSLIRGRRADSQHLGKNSVRRAAYLTYRLANIAKYF